MESNFELHSKLEAEIKSLTEKAEIRARESGIEKNEAMSSTVRERINELASKIPTEQRSGILPEYSSETSGDVKLYVEQIVDELWHDGDLVGAASKAQRGGPLAFDLFHDVLVKLSEKMKEKGII